MAFEITGLALMSFAFFWVAMNTDKEKWTGAAMQTLFTGLGLFFILITLQVGALDATAQSLSEVANALWLGYGIFVYVTIFVLAFMIITLFWEAASMASKQGDD